MLFKPSSGRYSLLLPADFRNSKKAYLCPCKPTKGWQQVKAKKPTPLALQPGDYYFNEQGLMVFTRQYHLRRGFCCGSGCRHCPWREPEKAKSK